MVLLSNVTVGNLPTSYGDVGTDAAVAVLIRERAIARTNINIANGTDYESTILLSFLRIECLKTKPTKFAAKNHRIRIAIRSVLTSISASGANTLNCSK